MSLSLVSTVRKFRTHLILALVLGLCVGFIAPTLALAAGPLPQAAPADTTAGALYALIAFLMTAVSGGAVAFILDDLKPWKNWDNAGAKTTIVLLLNAGIGAGLLAAQPYIPSGLDALPAPLVVFLGFFVSYLVNQLTHQADAKFSAWKTEKVATTEPWNRTGKQA